MDPAGLVRRLRLAAGLSQRELAGRAQTSQSAVARYETGAATPGLATLERLTVACGHRLELLAELDPDEHDVQLALDLLEMAPAERLSTLANWAQLRAYAVAQ